ncbi:5'-nucleotidase YjjG [Vibrio sp. JCM 19236]|nr:5'-nucleotidase YjjG [Vibrio sp. JCM 19236]
MTQFFEHVVISEQVGVAKPDKAIFDYALQKIGNPCKSRVLMVGDNLFSDILGGNNSGIETCWLNTQDAAMDEKVLPSYTVASLSDLQTMLKA